MSANRFKKYLIRKNFDFKKSEQVIFMRMGVNVKIEGSSAVLKGKSTLSGAKVKATDLRAGAALILAGLVADGETEITEVFHIKRGYANIVEKLQSVGANIRFVE